MFDVIKGLERFPRWSGWEYTNLDAHNCRQPLKHKDFFRVKNRWQEWQQETLWVQTQWPGIRKTSHDLMRLFRSTYLSLLTRILWLILLSKIWEFSNLVKFTSKNFWNSKASKFVFIFFSSFNGCWVINNFVTFHWIKVAKHIRDSCCHLTSESGGWFIMIAIIIFVRVCVISLSKVIIRLSS
jgi:hypothetical protein